MPHPLELQRGSNAPPSRHVKATVQNLFPCVKPFIQMFVFCNKQLAAVWFKICVNCNFNDNRVICNIKTQLKYPSSLKDILRRFLRQGLISLKMLFLESPHSMGFFKGSQRARSIQPKFPEISVQNSMYRFGPTAKVSKKRFHLLRWSSFPGRTGWNFGGMDRAQMLQQNCEHIK